MATPTTSSTVQQWPWEQTCLFFAKHFRLGQHVAVEGPNGSGKSILMLSLLMEVGATMRMKDHRPVRITVLAESPRDRTLTALGWPVIREAKDWPPGYGEEHVIVWPRYGDPMTVADRQAAIFRPILHEIFKSGNQIVYIDEAAYFEQKKPNGLDLGPMLDQYWRQSRKLTVSLWAGTQRPVNVSRAMWSEPYWLFLFRPEDDEDLKVIADRSGQRDLVRSVLPQLDTHEFLMLRRRPERLAVVSQVTL